MSRVMNTQIVKTERLRKISKDPVSTRTDSKTKMVIKALTGMFLLFLLLKKAGNIFWSAELAISLEEASRLALTPLAVETNTSKAINPAAHPPITFSSAVMATKLDAPISAGVNTY